MKTGPSVAALFAGIGGIEEGLRAAGGHTKLTCEVWEPAQAVLAARFPGAEHVQDIRDLDALPEVDLVTAGFPCTDLSQAGRTAGIGGAASGLVSNVFRLLNAAQRNAGNSRFLHRPRGQSLQPARIAVDQIPHRGIHNAGTDAIDQNPVV